MKGKQLKAFAAMLSLSMAFGIGVPDSLTEIQAATEHWNDASGMSREWTAWKDNWDAYSSNYENVSLTPGVNERELNFAWYSKTVETPSVRISRNADMSGAASYTGTQETAVTIGGVQYYSNKATVKDLAENTEYYYQVLKNGTWADAEEYSTKSFSDFSFLYVGDPQIGASRGQTSEESEKMNGLNQVDSTADQNLAARNDGYNWNKVLDKALAEHSDVSFMVSAGDQVNYAKNEREYAAYLGADALRSLPVATTIGNHDSGSGQYSLHYNNPNAFDGGDTKYTNGKTAAGTDYYYTYGNVLFIVLDTNNYNCATHDNVIQKAVSENPDAKWRVVMFHQDIYGSGLDHSDSDGMVLRTQLTPIFDRNHIDVVLQGHDHTYSRTYQLSGDGKEHTAYSSSPGGAEKAAYLEQNNCYIVKSGQKSGTVVNPEGTVYLEANSSTGSKFYELIPTRQDYIAERSQTWTPSYSVIDVDENSFSVTSYDGKSGQRLKGSSTYTIVKDKRTAQVITGTGAYTKKTGDAAFRLDASAEGKLSYESDNEDVAVVSKSGKVHIIGEGTAVITVRAAATDTKAEASKKITVTVLKADNKQDGKQDVKQEVKSQKIRCKTSYTKAYGDKAFALAASTDGNGKLSYASSDKKVASVNGNGKVTVKGIGTAVITVKAAATDSFAEASASVKITVNPKKAAVSKVVSKKKAQATITWKKDSMATGYKIVYASNKSFTQNVTTVSVDKKTGVSLTVKKLTGKKVYVKVCAYKKVNGKKMYGKYSAVKSAKVK